MRFIGDPHRVVEGNQDFMAWSESVGLAAPVAFAFSSETEACNGTSSRTQSGFFDVDGDGKPEMVQLNGASLDVYQLGGGVSTRVAEAGHLVGVDNGYGAHTTIFYRSAKDDAQTQHQLPFAEVVVGEIDVNGQLALGGNLATTRYAYGNAQMFYDPMHERWRFPGYGRTVELRVLSSASKSAQEGTVTDRTAIPGFDPSQTPSQRFGRYLVAGRVTDVSTLAGVTGFDPWQLLTINIAANPLVVGSTHYAYDTMFFPESSGSPGWETFDVMYPYNWALSFGSNNVSFDATNAHGFIFRTLRDSWRGSAAPPSANNVERRDTVRSVDAYGNPLAIFDEGDIYRGDDDTCINTTFAAATTPFAPTNRPIKRVLSSCNPLGAAPLTFAVDSWEYDQLAVGSVATGLTTAHTVERHADDNGVLLGTIREFDAVYDAAGNLTTMTRIRDDGAQQVTTMAYDAFGLAPTRVALSGSSVPTLTTTATVDQVSEATATITDPDGTVRGTTYDGFLRPLLSTVSLPGGALGVLEQTSYLGFGTVPPDGSGRRVVVKRFTDGVATSAVATAPGRVSTTYLDELGRTRMTLVALGSDYSGETLVVGARTYDLVGRVVFEAAPYGLSQLGAPYGTTRYFNPDHSPLAEIRGYGQQALTSLPNATNELFPTLYTHSFASHIEQLSTQDAASLTSGSQQNGVVSAALTSALGRLLFRSTWQAGTRLEHAAFAEDHQGRLTAMIRYGDPVNALNPVQRLLRFDSLGQVIEVDDAIAAPQTRYYDSFGDVTEIRTTPIAPEPTHSVVQRYDAFGRVTHHEEQNGGITDLATLSNYDYDVARVASPQVQPTNVLGRLAHASAPTTEQFFSYDGFGRVNARTFTDQGGSWYVEKRVFHGDGSTASIELDLPDNSYNPERVDYGYDSAGRLRTMQYSDASIGETTPLYHATTIDTFGRVRAASFPNATMTAQFADVGRRLPQSVVARSSSGSRTINFGTWDPLGREVTRSEDKGAGPTSFARAYDALGRLSIYAATVNGTTTEGWVFAYDALGNVMQMSDTVGSSDSALTYLTTDYDRLCRLRYGDSGLVSLACNVVHDNFGNVVSEATRTGTRKLSYFNSGGARHIDDPAGSADFAYDAFGQLQSIDFSGSGDQQSDRNFGELMSSRYRLKGTMKASYLARKFPASRFRVSRRGYRGPWVFELDEARGTRFSFDDGGAFVQDLAYAPFGEAKSSGSAQVATTRYSSDQWNGGEAFDRLGLVQLGARMYDPVIGRFLSRDPLFVPRTSTTTNPYAFAFNDPVNHADPTGANGDPPPNCEGQDECNTGQSGSDSGFDFGYDPTTGAPMHWNWSQPSQGHTPTPKFVAPKPIERFNEPTTEGGESGGESGGVDEGIEKGGFVADSAAALLDGIETTGWLGHASHAVGKVAAKFEVIGWAASGYGALKHPNVEHVGDFALSSGALGFALTKNPFGALAFYGGKVLWWTGFRIQEINRQEAIETDRRINLTLDRIDAKLDGMLYLQSDEFNEQGCFLLGGHDSITEENTRVRNVAGGFLVDGIPQNSSSMDE